MCSTHRQQDVAERFRIHNVIPSTITIIGLAVGLLGLFFRQPLFLIISLLADLADGAVARKLKAVYPWGAAIDWHTDCALAHGTLWVLGLWPGCLPLVIIQASAHAYGKKLSGRTLLFLTAAGWFFYIRYFK